MNREIEFRGQCVLNGEWLYGDLEYSRNDKDVVRIHTYNDDGSYKQQCLVVPDTVGQFTGLVDKNGVKIFEGDIIRFVNGLKTVNGEWVDNVSIHTIEYSEGAFRGVTAFAKDLEAVEVIGNIHDNPELLFTK